MGAMIVDCLQTLRTVIITEDSHYYTITLSQIANNHAADVGNPVS